MIIKSIFLTSNINMCRIHKNFAIILSGGTGQRLGETIPKQYIKVKEQMIISYSLKTFANHPLIHAIIIVVSPEWKSIVEEDVKRLGVQQPVYYAKPGETRQYSIYNGMNALQGIAKEKDQVIIHDAARPLVSEVLITRCLTNYEGYDGVLPILPVNDTVYFSEDKQNITQLLPRHCLFAGQAPESFVYGKYIRAHLIFSHEEMLIINGSTELAYKAGMNMKLILGDPSNFKITTQEDLLRFELLI